MTTPHKQYQNVSYKELLDYSEKNPNRTRTLDSIEVLPSKSQQDTSLDTLGLKGYRAVTLNPTGILSLMTCIQDPNCYALSPKNARLQQIIDLATKLQEETETMKNSELSRKRKKVHDLIGACYNNATIEEKDYLTLFHGISHLRNIHFILMKEAIQENIEEGATTATTATTATNAIKGEIVFSSDPTMWKRENPIWIADYRSRWIAIPSEDTARDIRSTIPTWLTTVEQTGWIVQWPEMDGTKTELVEQLSALPTWQIADKKLTKEVLAIRLGRAKTIQLFTGWCG